MEFSPRGFQRNTNRAASPSTTAPAPSHDDGPAPKQRKKHVERIKENKLMLVLIGLFFISATILVVASIAGISTKTNEQSYVNANGYQVVAFLDKQAYFGKIKEVNNKYIVLEDVYYLQDGSVNQQEEENANATPTLIKRGCEIHKPKDRMIIYIDQVNFWENLEADGKVVEAIGEWKKANPDGQTCNTNGSSSQPAPGTDTQQSASDQSTGTDTSTGTNTTAPSSDTSTTDSSTSSNTQTGGSSQPTPTTTE